MLQHRERLTALREKYTWDEKAAERAVRFIEGNLRHWKEPHAGKPFILSPWQRELVVKPLFGLRRADGTRLFRRAYIRLARKNGKSALAAALLLLILCTDGEGLDLYTVATKREQAMIVFNDCEKFVKSSPKLRKRLRVYRQSIVYPKRASKLGPLSSDHNNLDGLNTSAAVVDELHAHRSPHIRDVVLTSMGARTQPLLIQITTAGEESSGVCFDEDEYACKVLDGALDDDGYFALIAEADKELDWTDPLALVQANPNLGVSARKEYLEENLKVAMAKPSAKRTFQRYHLNRWTEGGAESWIPMDAWRKNRREFDLSQMAGRRCYGGLDLASVTDLASLALLFPWDDGSIRLLNWYWCPEENILERSRTDRVHYDVWRDDGRIRATPGDVIDYRRIVDDIKDLRELYNIRVVAFDEWNAASVNNELQEDGLDMVKFIQGLKSFHPPSYEFEKRIRDGSLHHDGNPVTTWNASNVKVLTDVSGKIRPVKDNKSSRKRIDGVIAAIMGLDVLMREEGKKPHSYDVPDGIRSMIGA